MTVANAWTRESAEMIVALGGVESVAFDDARIPQVTWESSGPGFWVHLLGYLEPNDGLWRWVVEARARETSPFMLTSVQTADRDEAFTMLADVLNQFVPADVATAPVGVC